MKFSLKIFDLYAKFTKEINQWSELSSKPLNIFNTFLLSSRFCLSCHRISIRYWVLLNKKSHWNDCWKNAGQNQISICNNFPDDICWQQIILSHFQNISSVWNCLEIWAMIIFVTMMSWVWVWLEIIYNNKITKKNSKHSILLLFIVRSTREKALHSYIYWLKYKCFTQWICCVHF